MKLDFKDKAKPKVGSKENAKHIPGGGSIKSSATPPKTPQDTNNDIQTQKIDIKAESKVGSLDNVKHKPGGGDKKIFNDKEYLDKLVPILKVFVAVDHRALCPPARSPPARTVCPRRTRT